MELGIRGKRAIVCAASKGLGKACAEALAAEGVSLLIMARTEGPLQDTAAAINKKYGVEVKALACDITTPEGRAAVLAAYPDPDILVNNAGGPPQGDFRDWDEATWQKAVNGNMITPIMLIRSVIDGMIARKFGRIVNITSGAVKAPIPDLGLSNGARAGLTGFVSGLARQVAQHNVTINNLLPGLFETDRLRGNMANLAAKEGITPEQKLAQRRAHVPAKRLGDPPEFGAMCAYMCSARASYMVGQNILLDGGHYPGTL